MVVLQGKGLMTTYWLRGLKSSLTSVNETDDLSSLANGIETFIAFRD